MKLEDAMDKLAVEAARLNPGTAKERWESMCIAQLLFELSKKGRDIAIVVSPGNGQVHVITESGRQ